MKHIMLGLEDCCNRRGERREEPKRGDLMKLGSLPKTTSVAPVMQLNAGTQDNKMSNKPRTAKGHKSRKGNCRYQLRWINLSNKHISRGQVFKHETELIG